ncbi:hypothetical protein M422DRAFT_248332, partial [Sphaerobolus stellatus SS14]
LYIPSLLPPVNRETLRELDLECILRNPQLRHDLLFDPNLQFRPSTSHRKELAADRFWFALARELDTGCVCTAWDINTGTLRAHCGRQVQEANLRHPGTYSSVTTKQAISEESANFSSSLLIVPCSITLAARLPTMLHTMLRTLHYIIAPPPPLSPLNSPPSHARPTYLAALAEADHLISHFDISLMEQEIRRGIFEPEGLFRLIGETLQKHCAPMRDNSIEAMVEFARRNTIKEDRKERNRRMLGAARMCFEIIDLMKLDIANHQLQHLRPLLIQSTPECELRAFIEELRRGSKSLDVTREWLKSAEASFPSSSPSSISKTLIQAFTNLVFNPPDTNVFGASSSSERASESARLPALPETLHLDSSRLQLLITDAADLTTNYMLLLLWRSMIFSPPPSDSEESDATPRRKGQVESWEIERMKKEIGEVGPGRIGRCFLGKIWGGFADYENREDNIVNPEKNWEDDMEGVIIQAVMRAEEARSYSISSKRREENPYLTPTSPSDRVIRPLPSASSLSLMRGWVKAHLKRDSTLATKMKDVLMKEVERVTEEMVQSNLAQPLRQQYHQSQNGFKSYPCPPALLTLVTPSTQVPSPPASPTPSFNSTPATNSKAEITPSPPNSGLEPLRYEITYLAARLAKVIGMHEKIYGPLYNSEGFSTSTQ